MKYKYLLLFFALAGFAKKGTATDYSYQKYSDTSGTQDNVAMNYTVSKPDKIGTGSFYMYPNPAKGTTTIYINSFRESDQGECVLFNSSGQAVLVTPVSNGNNNINVGSLAAGLYVVKIITNDKSVITMRLVVTR